ncbi:MAG: hypothetical protein R3Y07_05655 [Eubacteriales bacterium]
MIDYYYELDMDASWDLDKISKHLVKSRKKHTMRLNAPDLEKRQQAERALQYVDEAETVFANANSKKTYDNNLKASGNTTPVVEEVFFEEPQQQQNQNQNQNQQYQQNQNQQQNQGPSPVQLEIDALRDTYNNKNYPDAINRALALINAGNDTEMVYYWLVYSIRMQQNYRDSLDWTNKGLQKYPNSVNLTVCRISIHARNLKEVDIAGKYYKEALKRFPDNQYIENIGVEWLSYSEGFTPKVLAHIDSLVKKYPSDKFKTMIANSLINIGDSYLVESRFFKDTAGYRCFLKARKLARQYNPSDRNIELLERAKELGKKTFYSSGHKYWIGVMILSMFVGNPAFGILSLFGFCLQIYGFCCIYALFEPKWATVKRNRTKKDHFLARAFDPIKDLFFFIKSKINKD